MKSLLLCERRSSSSNLHLEISNDDVSDRSGEPGGVSPRTLVIAVKNPGGLRRPAHLISTFVGNVNDQLAMVFPGRSEAEPR